ncbi:hypothetical protein D3C87_1688180 [compost metagenome]
MRRLASVSHFGNKAFAIFDFKSQRTFKINKVVESAEIKFSKFNDNVCRIEAG